MPSANFGERTNLDNRSLFVELKEKGESIRFMLAGGGFYDGKHFMASEDGGWNVIDCPRIMKNEPCEMCETYFELRREAKDQEGAQKEATLKKARSYNAKITFYYPIVDLDLSETKVLKTVLQIRTKLEGDFKQGINVLEQPYKLSRTEDEDEYFKLEKITPFKLSQEQQEAYDEAKKLNLEEIVIGKKSSQSFESEVKEAIL
ncbi:MAG: hypothetical protein GYA14_12820 [Ignavibacteria bacterium]|nr:hypothetical protein [Ignavibacteria bacterium]